MKQTTYLIQVDKGVFSDPVTTPICTFKNKLLAEKYINKSNSMLKKWKEYYDTKHESFTDDIELSKFEEVFINRMFDLGEINGFTITEIEER